jgi:hypothetical protein
MHAIVVNVSIGDRQAAQGELREQVVPRISAAPGFVAGYWVQLENDKGTSIAVFESEEAARGFASGIQPPSAVTLDSVQVGEVVAHA